MNSERQLQEAIIEQKDKFIEDVIKPFYYDIYKLDGERIAPNVSYEEKKELLNKIKNDDKIIFVGQEILLDNKRCDLLFKIQYEDYDGSEVPSKFYDYIIIELKNRPLEVNDISQVAEYRNLLQINKENSRIYCILLGTYISNNLASLIMGNLLDKNLLISTFDFDLKYKIDHSFNYKEEYIKSAVFDSRLRDDNNE